jgi:hypothetical protein
MKSRGVLVSTAVQARAVKILEKQARDGEVERW